MTLVKAVIEILDRDVLDPEKGLLPFIPVQFNPTEYTLAKSAQIAEIAIPGIDAPIQQFIRGQTEKLTLELYFDTTDLGRDETAVPVDTLVRPVDELVRIQPRTHAPPRVCVTWGLGLSFRAIVESVQRRYTLFSPLGVPLRATVSVTFRGYRTLDEQLAELNLQSSDHTSARAVSGRSTLSRIAGEELGDPREWRAIADENPGVDPLSPAPGTVLTIPAVDAGPRTVRR
jgi:Contractile injection system tube protein